MRLREFTEGAFDDITKQLGNTPKKGPGRWPGKKEKDAAANRKSNYSGIRADDGTAKRKKELDQLKGPKLKESTGDRKFDQMMDKISGDNNALKSGQMQNKIASNAMPDHDTENEDDFIEFGDTVFNHLLAMGKKIISTPGQLERYSDMLSQDPDALFEWMCKNLKCNTKHLLELETIMRDFRTLLEFAYAVKDGQFYSDYILPWNEYKKDITDMLESTDRPGVRGTKRDKDEYDELVNSPNYSDEIEEFSKKPILEKDEGKHNNGKTTGFKVVAKKAAAEYGSKEAGKRVAGAIRNKMKKG